MRTFALTVLAAGAALIPAGVSAQVVHHAPGHVVQQHGGFMHPGMHFPHHRLHRGFVIHPFFFGPQFHIQNWQLFGFAPPPADHRWVRYHDDAYLIGPDGRVMDERYDVDWEDHGDWYGHYGDHDRGAWTYHHGYAPYGYYGWGVAYPMVIETTVVTGGSHVGHVVEEVDVRHHRHRVRPHCDCHARPVPPPPPPPPLTPPPSPQGERG